MRQRNALLVRLIEVLVDEWGPEQVETTVHEVVAGGVSGPQETGTHPAARSAGSRASRKFNAAEQVERLGEKEPRRDVLLEIAEQYDRKQFLPSVADLREFLILSGERPSGIKDRTEGFRILLKVLLSMPTDRLRDVSSAAKHAGPSKLGPISDAISAAGERMAHQHQPHGQGANYSVSDAPNLSSEANRARKVRE